MIIGSIQNLLLSTDAFWSKLGLQLVGPYDVLAGRTCKKNSRGRRPCYLRHWRYYYDPPEFLTVLRGDDASQFHMGYFRSGRVRFSCSAKSLESLRPWQFKRQNFHLYDMIARCVSLASNFLVGIHCIPGLTDDHEFRAVPEPMLAKISHSIWHHMATMN